MSTLDTGNGAACREGLARIRGVITDVSHPDYLSYHYLCPCIAQAGARMRGRLVDIGCGNKPYRKLFPGITEYVGCDIVQSSDNVVDVIAPAAAIPLPGGSFDVALCTQTVEHVPDPIALVREASRLLKVGGVFLISGPMYWPLHEEPYDFHRFTKYGFVQLLETAGFIRIKVTENGGKWSVVGLALLHAIPERLRARRRVVRCLNRFFLWLDGRWYDPVNTSNYFVEAVKASAPAV
jgi:SAM-dependent methyltransferase